MGIVTQEPYRYGKCDDGDGCDDEYRIFLMGGYDITVPGYWRTLERAEQEKKEGW